jgi:hypothetical protein
MGLLWFQKSFVRKGSPMLLALVGALLSVGCERRFVVEERMTWECAPELSMQQYPDAQPVRFRFVENPQFEEVEFGRGLCDQLNAAGRNVVVIKYEVWGNHSRGLIGFRPLLIDGKPIINAGGMGSSGANGINHGPHPFDRFFVR